MRPKPTTSGIEHDHEEPLHPCPRQTKGIHLTYRNDNRKKQLQAPPCKGRKEHDFGPTMRGHKTFLLGR
jgi:hypothetical protein